MPSPSLVDLHKRYFVCGHFQHQKNKAIPRASWSEKQGSAVPRYEQNSATINGNTTSYNDCNITAFTPSFQNQQQYGVLTKMVLLWHSYIFGYRNPVLTLLLMFLTVIMSKQCDILTPSLLFLLLFDDP